ncbi:Type II secretory pathway component ExeA (predicted ATPase)-like protein [Thioalkalivibrio sulfidiphilus HL-EbGr7]|uniref:Type II secretory pathway component ExeA (Predicted ATPase)-like protein n=1 Tax=Thioalkalivibrio sulfidiphilus (strain HL-EbGR7) TaxID=396588 RepID=B8GVC8_THISH|nr:AAA family ATPase [Thioalkalivibrio sulfidiphilus]ACL73474.1 Type II secretory pathway component ExeA (predicted ATPase)-like protein [Thioalkalivibrio sulfidiphilus HL-EbGr7]
MYLEFFNLDRPPFQLAPDSGFLYMSKPHARALAYMKYTVLNRDGFAVVTGEIGSGKTIVLERLLDSLDDSVTVARIHQTQLSEVEFLQHLATILGIKSPQGTKVELIEKLNRYLADQGRRRRSVLLVVDESQNLGVTALEEIRLLSDGESSRNKVLSVILVGQPELADRLDDPVLEQLEQRIRLRFHLRPLNVGEIGEYIRHRLEVAGWQGADLFDDHAVELIHHYTGGIPRLINVLCDTVLLAAFIEETREVSRELVESSIEELQWVPFEQRRAILPVTEEAETVSSEAIRPAAATGARLVVSLKDRVLSTHMLTEPVESIGRITDNRIQLAHMSVSRHHAAILHVDQHFYLVDFNSLNGVKVNGEPVVRHQLRDGDRIGVGCYQMTFHLAAGITVPRNSVQEDTITAERGFPDRLQQTRVSSSPS